MKTLWLPFLALILVGCASRPDPAWTPSPAQAELVNLTTTRLELAREVAWIKFRDGLPVLDRKRESESLDRVVALGVEQGLSAKFVQRFFQAQMAASRAYQSRLISQWKDGGPLPLLPPRSLTQDIRPEIDSLNRQILAQLAVAGPQARGPQLASLAQHQMRQKEIPGPAIQRSMSALR
ncbi:MAG: gamma subclass chorismate mutase AroQ [Terrimicrobiaceae bacterium]